MNVPEYAAERHQDSENKDWRTKGARTHRYKKGKRKDRLCVARRKRLEKVIKVQRTKNPIGKMCISIGAVAADEDF